MPSAIVSSVSKNEPRPSCLASRYTIPEGRISMHNFTASRWMEMIERISVKIQHPGRPGVPPPPGKPTQRRLAGFPPGGAVFAAGMRENEAARVLHDGHAVSCAFSARNERKRAPAGEWNEASDRIANSLRRRMSFPPFPASRLDGALSSGGMHCPRDASAVKAARQLPKER